MSAAPDVVHPQKHDELGDSWNNSSSIRTKCMKLTLPQRQIIAEGLSTGDVKVRKPYTITKQRERWTELEHQKFLEALKLYGRAWQRIEEHIGTKTAVQIRSHAQKVFSKLERGVPTGKSAEAEDIDIPPPRPKRKPSHPYPKKAVYNTCVNEVNKHPTSSSSEIVAKTEPVGFTPYTGNRGAELGASAEAHPHNQNDGVKLFAKPVIVPKAQKLAAPINHLPRENVSESTCIQINKAKSNAGFLPFVGLQKGLTPVSIQCTVLHTDQNSGTITEEGCTDESREVACTNTGSNAKYEANGMDYESTSCAETHKDAVDHIKNGKVDSVSNKDPAKALKSDPHNSTDYLFSYYTGAQHNKPQGSLDGSLANPMLFWHFLQTAALNNPFQYATIGGWRELTGSTQKCGNDIHFLPSYSGGASFASSWNFRGSEALGQQDSLSCERVPRSTLGVCRIKPMKSSECTTEMKEHRLQPISISGIAEESNVTNHKRNNVHLGNGNGNTIPDMEIHQETGLIKQSDAEFDDIVKDARNHAEQSFSTSIDEFDEGNGKKKSSVDGSSSGSNNPLEGCQVSEAETPDNLKTNKKYNEENTNPEESDSGTRGCPKVRFKHIEKRKRYQQRDLKNGSTEDYKRPKGYPHDVDSWKEVSEEGRKAFRALFTGKTLPQTFPKNGTLDGYLHTQNPDKDCDGIMAHGPVLKVVKEEENTKNVAKFSVSSRSGFVPYQRAKPEVTCTV